MVYRYNNQICHFRVPGFGNSSTVEYLDSSRLSLSTYFAKVADQLVQGLGYTRGRDLHGAPYDFRKAPSEGGVTADLRERVHRGSQQLFSGPP